MSHKKKFIGDCEIIRDYYVDVNNLGDMLSKLVNSYRLLIGGAGELNSIGLVHKNDIKKAIKRANELGCIIDNIIDGLDCCTLCYIDYCRARSELVQCQIVQEKIIQDKIIQTEVDKELEFNNSERQVDE